MTVVTSCQGMIEINGSDRVVFLEKVSFEEPATTEDEVVGMGYEGAYDTTVGGRKAAVINFTRKYDGDAGFWDFYVAKTKFIAKIKFQLAAGINQEISLTGCSVTGWNLEGDLNDIVKESVTMKGTIASINIPT